MNKENTPAHQQELEYKAILDHAGVAIIFTCRQRVVRCNRHAEDLFGWPPGTLVGQPGAVFYPGEEAYRALGALAGPILAAGETLDTDIDFARRDGSRFFGHVIGRAVNPGDADAGTIWIARDVTAERLETAARSRLLREQQLIFERAQIGILFTRDRRILRCNPRFEQILGFAPGSLVGQLTRVFAASEDDWQDLGRRSYAAIAADGIFVGEERYVRQDGTTIWCHVTGSMLNPDNPDDGYVWLYEDVTARHDAVAALDALLHEQTLIFNRVPSGILFVKNRVIQRCNPRFAEIFGYLPEQLAGQSTRIYHRSDEDFAIAGERAYAAIVATGTYSGDECYGRRDGRMVWCHITGCLIDPARPDFGHVFMFEDITEKRHAAATLNALVREQTLIFERVHTGILFLRGDRILRCNPRCAEIFGVAASALAGQSTRALYPDESSWRTTVAEVQRDFARQGFFDSQVRFARDNGAIVTCHVIGRLVDPDDAARESVWLLEDVTERLAADAALAEVHREQQLIFDNAMIGIAYQRQRTILRCNRRMEEIFGYPPGSLSGCSMRILFASDEDWDEAGRRVYRPGVDDQTFDGEMLYKKRDGTPIYVHIVGRTTSPAGENQTWIWTYEDVTARRAAEAALQRANREYALIFDNAMIGISYMRDRVFLRCNRRVEEIFGFAPGTLVGKNARVLFASDAEYDEAGQRVYAESLPGQGFSGEIQYTRQDGTPIWVRATGKPIHQGENQIWVWTHQDVTRRHVAEQALLQSHRELEAKVEARTAELTQQLHFMHELIEAIPGPVFYKDRAGRYLGCNQAFADFLGRRREDLIGRTASDTSAPHRAEVHAAVDEALLATSGSLVYETEVEAAGGEVRQVMFHKASWVDADGKVGGILGVMLDITERKQLEIRLQQAATVFDSTAEGVTITAPDGSIIAVNRAFTEITGYESAEVVGSNPRLLQSGRHDEAFYRAMWDTIARSGRWQGELWNRRKDGTVFPEWLTISAVKDTGGEVTHYVGVFSDISAIKKAQAQLDYQAHHDPLTGLPNRLLLEDRLRGALHRARRENTSLALLFVDLDRFKNINDTLGHHIGDRVLCEVAWRFGALTRESDTVARLGGDEFLIIVEGITEPAAASRIADKILEDLRLNPVTVEQEFFVGASIGISLFPQDGDDAATLMKHADVAMYRAKERGRNTFEFFTNDLTTFSLERFQMETGLRRAIERDELRVYLQPQFCLGSGRLIGAETLVRWQHPELGLVPPGQFIPLAEESGLIVPMGQWVQRNACRQWAEWLAAGHDPGVLSINVSGIEFRRGHILDSVREALTATGLPATRLELEITESAIMSQAENSIQVLHDLREMGLSLAIDDFGTGYSSLAYLKRLPLNKLKVDQGFVRGLPADAEDAAIVRAVIALGHSLQLKVIAEGVETDAQRQFLTAEGCDEMQGFLRGRPVPLAEFAEKHLPPPTP